MFLGLQDGWQHPDPSQLQTRGEGPPVLNLKPKPSPTNAGLSMRTNSYFLFIWLSRAGGGGQTPQICNSVSKV